MMLEGPAGSRMPLLYYFAGAAGTGSGDGAAGASHVDQAVDTKGDEGKYNEEDDDDDGNGVVFFDHVCGGVLSTGLLRY